MEGDSSRTALISAAGTRAKTSWTVVVVSAQNWSQKASSVASTGCEEHVYISASVHLSHLSEVCEAQCSDSSCSSSTYHVACFHHKAHNLLRLYSSAQACPNGYVNTTSTPNNSEEGADLSTVHLPQQQTCSFPHLRHHFFFGGGGGLATPSSKSKHVNPE